MTAEEMKKVAVDFLRLAGQGHPREMQGVLKAGGIHHNVYVQRGWDALLTAMEEAGKKPPKRPDPVLYQNFGGGIHRKTAWLRSARAA